MKGIYVLVIHVAKDVNVNIGALGKTAFKKGLYAYVGSAQTNLEQRVRRHLRKEKQKFWHIDHLLDSDTVKIIKVFYKKGNKSDECKIAEAISKRSKLISGFGCSDCNCKSHLFHIEDYKFIQETMQVFPAET